MDALQSMRFGPTLPESSVAIAGLVLGICGVVLPAPPLVGLGIALFVGGVVYAGSAGRDILRFALAFVALVAVQLLTFGATQWVGAVVLGAVAVVVLYTRLGATTVSQ